MKDLTISSISLSKQDLLEDQEESLDLQDEDENEEEDEELKL